MDTTTLPTTDQAGPAGATKRSRLRRGVVASAIAAASLVGIAAPAHAWTASGPGTYGAVSGLTVRVTDTNRSVIGPGQPGSVNMSAIFTPGITTAARSTATTAQQTICHSAALQSWNGSAWVNVRSTARSCAVAGTGGVRFTDAPAFEVSQAAGGYFRIAHTYGWFYASNGSQFAGATVVPTGADQVCATTVRYCTSSGGYTRIGQSAGRSW